MGVFFSKPDGEAGLRGVCEEDVCAGMCAGTQRANVVVFHLVCDAWSLVSGLREGGHPSMDLAPLGHIASTFSATQSGVFSSLCPRQVLGRFVSVEVVLRCSLKGLHLQSVSLSEMPGFCSLLW